MDLNINKKYLIRVNSSGRILTYEATVISQDETFITFIDKFNTTFHINKNVIIGIEEMKE